MVQVASQLHEKVLELDRPGVQTGFSHYTTLGSRLANWIATWDLSRSQMDTSALQTFLNLFRSSFRPPTPSRGKVGTKWWISGVWSDCTRGWLRQIAERVEFEIPISDRKRLDAGLWLRGNKGGAMDVALEWEWDQNRVDDQFPEGDFRKVLEVQAACGLAIFQTRSDGRQSTLKADRTLESLRMSWARHKVDSRPVVLIEIRRVYQDKSRVEFIWTVRELNAGGSSPGVKWTFFPTGTGPTIS